MTNKAKNAQELVEKITQFFPDFKIDISNLLKTPEEYNKTRMPKFEEKTFIVSAIPPEIMSCTRRRSYKRNIIVNSIEEMKKWPAYQLQYPLKNKERNQYDQMCCLFYAQYSLELNSIIVYITTNQEDTLEKNWADIKKELPEALTALHADFFQVSEEDRYNNIIAQKESFGVSTRAILQGKMKSLVTENQNLKTQKEKIIQRECGKFQEIIYFTKAQEELKKVYEEKIFEIAKKYQSLKKNKNIKEVKIAGTGLQIELNPINLKVPDANITYNNVIIIIRTQYSSRYEQQGSIYEILTKSEELHPFSLINNTNNRSSYSARNHRYYTQVNSSAIDHIIYELIGSEDWEGIVKRCVRWLERPDLENNAIDRALQPKGLWYKFIAKKSDADEKSDKA